jgi:hypothetical protein
MSSNRAKTAQKTKRGIKNSAMMTEETLASKSVDCRPVQPLQQ